jgi:hypothetical protein
MGGGSIVCLIRSVVWVACVDLALALIWPRALLRLTHATGSDRV